MKKIVAVVLVLISTNIFGKRLAECGIDNEPKLTQSESDFLNEYISDVQRNDFDFTDKIVAFVTGPGASRIGTKSEYFDNIKKWNEKDSKITTSIVELNENEKNDSGGYDAIVTYWVKVVTKRRRRILVKKELKASK